MTACRRSTAAAASLLPSSLSSFPLVHASSRRHASGLSLSTRERQVLRLLQSVRHPSGATAEDIVFSGHVRSVTERNGAVSIVLPLDDAYRTLKRQITERLEAPDTRPDWLQGVRVVMESVRSPEAAAAASSRSASAKHDGLAQVRNIIAVSSCKGGVGKSTVAVNLAYALQKLQMEDGAIDGGDSPSGGPRLRDLRVGILDADIYGPSLPTMVSPRDTTLRYDEARRIVPPVYEGIKTMSYGYVKSSQQQQQQKQTATSGVGSAAADAASSGAFIRGPLASAAVKQLASETDWGALDYLIVDMPPGTGDIQLTLTQLLGFRAAVVVTTPGKLAFVDVVKGLELFERVRVPVLAVVENMSYFTCDNCDTKHRLFGEQGQQHMNDVQIKFGKKKIVEIPIWKQMAQVRSMHAHEDGGRWARWQSVLVRSDSDVRARSIARSLVICQCVHVCMLSRRVTAAIRSCCRTILTVRQFAPSTLIWPPAFITTSTIRRVRCSGTRPFRRSPSTLQQDR